jgi:ABC-type uncharacterized transport system permease subunit
LAGENPLDVLNILIKSSFGTSYDLGMTLFYASCLVLTGFAVGLALNVGLFNIGGEGQLIMGAFFAAITGLIFPHLPAPWAPLIAVLAAFLGGFLWAFIAGAMRAYRGCHEVISTIMLNFVAAGLCNYLTLYVFKNPLSQNPETAEIPSQYMIGQLSWFDGAPVSYGLYLGPILVIILGLFLYRTKWGLALRSVGQNEQTALFAGSNVKKIQLWTFAISGGIAGLVGVVEVLGNAGKFRIGFSSGLGFMGLAVALLGKNKPLNILLSALLFGALHKGSLDLDFETENVSRELSQILQALVILTVALGSYIEFRLQKNQGRK